MIFLFLALVAELNGLSNFGKGITPNISVKSFRSVVQEMSFNDISYLKLL